MPAVGVAVLMAVGRGSNERRRARAQHVASSNFSWGFKLVRPSSVIQLGVIQSSVIQLGVHLSVHPRETRGRRMGVGIVTDHTHRNRAGGISRLNRLVQALFMETPATMCGAISLRGLKRCR
jgi:hypothetical protein